MAAYVDTSAWIALHEPHDAHHSEAKRRLQRLLTERELLVTGWHTVVEFADGLQRHYGQAVAARETERITGSALVRVEDSAQHREAALALFRDRADWNVDLSDCLSFATMEARGVRQVFTFDEEFQKAGFEIV